MKINLLKYGKKALTVVLAIAVLAVSLFSAVGSIVVSAEAWDGTTATAYASGTGTEADPFIIENAAQLHKMVKEYGKDASGNAAYFKVADTVTEIVLNDVTGFSAATAAVGEGWENWMDGLTFDTSSANTGSAFVGKFDGNGAVIKGLYAYSSGSNAVGFIPSAGVGAVVTNVAFESAYVKNDARGAYEGAAVVAGRVNEGTGSSIDISKVSINNCYVSGGYGGAGFIGNARGNAATITTCILTDSNISGVTMTGGALADGWGRVTVSNSIFIGMHPERANTPYSPIFTNVYTDDTTFSYTNDYETVYRAANVGQLENADAAKGAAAQTNMPDLIWGEGGFAVGAEGEYPTFAQGEAYDGWNGAPSAELELLDPTQPNSENNPYLIQSAADMARLNLLGAASAGDANNATAGKYYKVADGIESIEFNPVSDLTTVAEVKAYFEDEDNIRTVYSQADAAAGTHYFAGTFDGNGCTFYGLYNVAEGGGLFAGAGAGAVIKNVKLANSYINSPFRAGGIVGQLSTGSSVTVQCCSVVDTFIHISGTGGNVGVGGIVGYGHAGAYVIESCLVADCEITRSENAPASMHAGGFVSDGWGSTRIIKDSICLGVTPGSSKGSMGTYTNVYTDVACDYTGVTVLTAGAAVKGAAAQESMPNLSWGVNWNTTENDYPANKVYVYEIDYDCFIGEQDTAFATWNGTDLNAGTASNPYKITNAAELFGMVTSGGAGKYYKVADGIDVIYGNPVKDVEDIKAYFEDEESLKFAWAPAAATFNGTFDGNGVTIVGLYNVVSNATSVGFIPQMNGGSATIKNVQFDSCYFQTAGSTDWRKAAGIITGGSTTTGGTINIESVVVKNSYAASIGTAASIDEANGNAAALVGSLSNNFRLTVNNVLTYGNTIIGVNNGAPAVIHGDIYSTNANQDITINISNAVIADNVPFVPNSEKVGVGTQDYENGKEATNTYSNIYTINIPEKPEKSFEGVTLVTDGELKGADLLLEGLDYTATWIATTSYPELRVFHTLEFAPDGDNGHGTICTDDGCDVSATLAPHDYDENYYCEACEYQHEHNMVDTTTGEPVDCTTGGTVNTECDKGCGYTSTRLVEATGHTFGEVIPATAGDCCNSGTVAYKVCEVCELKFAEDADDMSTEALETIETGVMGEHNWVPKTPLTSVCEGVDPLEYDKCPICENYRVAGEVVEEEPTIAGHTFGEIIPATEGDCCTLSTVAYKECEACELKFAADAEETATEALETIYGDYGDHNWLPQTPIAAGCEGGQPIAYDKCDICDKYLVGGEIKDEIPVAEGHVFGEVQTATAGDCCTLGTVAYKACLACGGNFAPDATKDATEALETIYTGYGEHNWVPQEALESVCSAVYDIEYAECDVCGKYLVGDEIVEEIEIAGHEFTYDYIESVCAVVYQVWYAECENCGELFDVDGNPIEEVVDPGHLGDPCECGYATIVPGWKFDAIGWWYQNADGSYPANAWFNDGGTWYYFNASGYMVTGWQSVGGTWYYFNASGAMATGWVFDGAWYYMDASGAMVTGWVFDGAWYYMDASGAMVTGWQAIGGTWYYFNASGAMLTGWQVIGGAWYYFYDSGAMAANCWVGNYWINADGVWA